MKILAIRKENSGSNHHRIYLPLSHFKEHSVTFCNDVFEYNVEDFDLIYNHWIPEFSIEQIREWKAKGIKYIQDVDDWIVLPPKHPFYNKVDYTALIDYVCIADCVVVSTTPLYDYFKNWNNNIHINYNALPYNFHANIVKDKIAIGWIGSSSHLPDLQSIEKHIKKIASNNTIQNKCKFVLCGVNHADPAWKHIIKLFKHSNMELELYEAKSPNDYLLLYQHINILLAPLDENDFNLAKSALKLQEAAQYNIPVIGSELYLDKEAHNLLTKDWIKNVFYLIDNLDEGINQAKHNYIDFDNRIEELEQILSNIAVPKRNVKIYSITYQNGQHKEFEEYRNLATEKLWRFEYNCMIDIIKKDVQEEYLGILSWKFFQKTKMYENLLYKQIEFNKSFDVYGFAPSGIKHYLLHTYRQHPGIKEILILVCNKLSLKLLEPKHIVYSNFFVTKTEIYKEYINTIVIPAIDYMENEIWELVNVDAQYLSGLNKEELFKLTGLNYYNMLTFVCERLFSIWLENNKQIKFKQML